MKNYEGFEGKIAVVTGGASGIGKAICHDLADQGTTVVVADINMEGAQETVKELETKGVPALAVQMDVSDEAAVEAGFKKAIDKFGTIDILVNNAATPGSGVSSPHMYSLPTSEWDHLFSIDMKGPVLCSKQVFELFREKKAGKIVNISSISGRMGSATVPAYGAIKAAVIQFTKTLAKDLAAYNVNANAICPGFLYTKLWQRMAADLVMKYPEDKRPEPYQAFRGMVEAMTPMKREQEVEDIAHLVTFLCSENAKNITGQAINVDGGTVMS